MAPAGTITDTTRPNPDAGTVVTTGSMVEVAVPATMVAATIPEDIRGPAIIPAVAATTVAAVEEHPIVEAVLPVATIPAAGLPGAV